MSTSNNYLPKGYKLESYRIEKVLGAGGFGVTYLAEDIHLNTQVVIKEFLPQEFSTRESGHQTIVPYTDSKENSTYEYLLKKFLKEAQILASIKHPNVVRVFSFFEANNTAYFVMDYIAGESLKSYLARKGELKEESILSIVMPILEGLKEVHLANYLHRDIAPDNIYLRQNGMPMLIDFGAAKNATRSESTSLAAIVKAGYSAPEQYTTNAKQNNATDIYAIGSVLYSMISKKVAPESTIRQMALLNDEEDPLEDVRNNRYYQKKYSNTLLETIHKALNIRPKNRFQSVIEMQENLFLGIKSEQAIQTKVGSKPTKKLNRSSKKSFNKKILYGSISTLALIGLFTLFSEENLQETVNKKPLALMIKKQNITTKNEVNKNLETLKKECDSGKTESCTQILNQFQANNQYNQAFYYADYTCTLGSPKGCGILSVLFLSGLGTQQNFQEAHSFAKKACDKNDSTGCMVHGLIHLSGLGTEEKNKNKANSFFKKAKKKLEKECAKNDAEACSNLGVIHQHGFGVPINKNKAVPFLQKACSLNDREACVEIGNFYYKGIIFKKNSKKAMAFYQKACDLNASEGCATLGVIYFDGIDTKKDEIKGLTLLKNSCYMSSSTGCYYTGLLYETVYKNPSESKKFYKKACDLYNKRACEKIAL